MYALSFKKKSEKLPEIFHTGKAQVNNYVTDLEKVKSTAQVKGLCIYKTPLEQMLVGRPYVVHHHYLIVDVAEVCDPKGNKISYGFHLRAEKVNQDDRGKNVGQDDPGKDGNDVTAGIIVKNVAIPKAEDAEVHYSASDLCVKISMSQLVDILTAHSPNYDLVVDNCWKYADATVRDLLTAFGKLQPDDAEDMTKHLQRMSTLVKPIIHACAVRAIVAIPAFFISVYTWVSTLFKRRKSD